LDENTNIIITPITLSHNNNNGR